MNAPHPYLPNVLARVTTCDDAEWWRGVAARHAFRFDGDTVLGVVSSGVMYDVGRLRRMGHVDAVEELVAAGILPEHWLDAARAPRWWCERCEGSGTIVGWTACECCGDGSCPCTWGSGDEVPPEPSRGELVAVSSLGAAAVARAEAVVAETWPRARLVWRVNGARRIRSEAAACVSFGPFGAAADGATFISSLALVQPELVEESLRWHGHSRGARAGAALGAIGLHVAGFDGHEVTIAVRSVAPEDDERAA